MHLQALTRPDLVFPDLPGNDRPTILQALADRIVERGVTDDAAALYAALWEREELGSTAIGHGVAIPHCKLQGLKSVVLAIGISRRPIEYEATDGEPVRLFFLLVSPVGAPADHLRSLAAVSRWLRVEVHLQRILAADSPAAVFALLGPDQATS